MDRSKLPPHKREELKRKEESERLNEVLQEFTASFDASATEQKTFIRGEVVNADQGAVPEQKGRIYRPLIPHAVLQRSTLLAGENNSGIPFEQARKMAAEKAQKFMQQAGVQQPQRPQMQVKIQQQQVSRPGPQVNVKGSRTSNLEEFKQELKALQDARTERRKVRAHLKEQLGADSEAIDRIAPSLDNPYLGGAFDSDPFTTNIFLSNLNPTISIEDLYEHFGRFGPLASAKVMWPRNEDEKHRGYLCGFVAFMTRKDTDRAVAYLRGRVVKGYEMKISWAKALHIPSQPVYIPPSMLKLVMPDPPSGLPFNARPVDQDRDDYLAKWGQFPRSGHTGHQDDQDWTRMIRNATVRVVIPTERPLLALIHRTIEFVVRYGPIFEAMLMSREMGNPTFRFLFDNPHPAHVYYRWKMFSILQGDPPNKWRMDTFRMFENGSIWKSPPMDFFRQGMPEELYDTTYDALEHERDEHHLNPELTAFRREINVKKRDSDSDSDSGSDSDDSRSGDSYDDEEDDKEGQLVGKLRPKRRPPSPRISKQPGRSDLSNRERDELEDLLRRVIPQRSAVEQSMIWCVEHANCAKEISECIYESLTIEETPLHKKIARLYLLADILANCGAPKVRDVFYFRQFIGERLELVFCELGKTYGGITARLKAEQFKQRVLACFRMWEEHALYPTDVLVRMQNVFLGLINVEQEQAGDNHKNKHEEVEEDIDGQPLESIDYDIDGAPMDGNHVQQSQKRPPNVYEEEPRKGGFKTSKWDEIDPQLVEQQAMTTSKWDSLEHSEEAADDHKQQQDDDDLDGVPMDDPVTSSQQSKVVTVDTEPKQQITEERRQLLRDIEVKVMNFQDELESGRRHLRGGSISHEVDKYRIKLLKEIEKGSSELKEEKKPSKEHKRREEKRRKRSRSPSKKSKKRSRSRSRSPSRKRHGRR